MKFYNFRSCRKIDIGENNFPERVPSIFFTFCTNSCKDSPPQVPTKFGESESSYPLRYLRQDCVSHPTNYEVSWTIRGRSPIALLTWI